MSAEATGYVWKHSPLIGAGLLVHLAIADVVNDVHDNTFWMTTSALADKARVSRRATVTALSELVHEGFLALVERGGGRGRGTTFRFLFPQTAHPLRSSGGSETAQRDVETAHSATETAQPDARHREEPNNPRTQACASADPLDRHPDPDCVSCQGRGTNGFAIIDQRAGATAPRPCACTQPGYEPRAARGRPPAGWTNPLATRREEANA